MGGASGGGDCRGGRLVGWLVLRLFVLLGVKY